MGGMFAQHTQGPRYCISEAQNQVWWCLQESLKRSSRPSLAMQGIAGQSGLDMRPSIPVSILFKGAEALRTISGWRGD